MNDLIVEDIHFSYGDTPALNGISFRAARGEFLAVTGPSGCGKTTFVNLITRELRPNHGTISLPAGGIAAVWQDDSTLPWSTLAKNIELPLSLSGVPAAERRKRALELLDAVGLAAFAKHYPGQISSGMRKRVQLAVALAARPALLVMDEPLSGLDLYTKLDIELLIQRMWSESGCTIVMVSHDVNEIVTLADRTVVLSSRPAGVRQIIENPLPRPRDPRRLLGDSKFHEHVREVWSLLSEPPA